MTANDDVMLNGGKTNHNRCKTTPIRKSPNLNERRSVNKQRIWNEIITSTKTMKKNIITTTTSLNWLDWRV